jgi:hypothetical protein
MASLKCNLGNKPLTGTLDGVTRTETVHKWHVLLEVSEDFIRRRRMMGKSMNEIIIEAIAHKAAARKGKKRSRKVTSAIIRDALRNWV